MITSVKGDLAQLRTWDSQASEVKVVDAEGVSRCMNFLPGTFQAAELRHEHGRRSEWLVSALLAEV